MFRELAQLAGTAAVLKFLTGYADDLTVHRDIHSWQGLLQAHQLITDLLIVVRRHGFQVNANKCSVMLKLVGRRAAAAYKQFTYWRTAPDGTMHRMWRLGSTKAQEGFPFVHKIKYLGVKLSYGNFEQATLQYRIQEGNVKLQKVRKYVPQQTHRRAKSALAHLECHSMGRSGLGPCRRRSYHRHSHQIASLARSQNSGCPQQAGPLDAHQHR